MPRMRETDFIAQNKQKWRQLEDLKAQKKKDPEKLSDLFIEVTNDLSYAKTYYPNRSIRVYLNNLAMAVHSSVYRTKRGGFAALGRLFLDRIPRVYFEARFQVLIAAVIFFFAMGVGVFSTSQDPGFVNVMLGHEYVAMTIDNIAKGDPMAVYKQAGEMDFATFVTFNNIYVSFRVFLLGLALMVGTVFALLFEGVRIGCFFSLFHDYDLLGESLLTVFMHGTPEISAIVLAGGAGLELGRGLVFPGTYARKEAFLLGARRSVLMILGLVPVFIFAGFIEGFVTRHTDLPDPIRLGFILICLGFMLTYFVIMPIRRFGKGRSSSGEADMVPEIPEHDYQMDKVKTHGQLFGNAFAMFSKGFFPLLASASATGLVYTVLLFLWFRSGIWDVLSSGIPASLGALTPFGKVFFKVDELYDMTTFPILYLLAAAAVGVAISSALSKLSARFDHALSVNRILPMALLISFLMHGLFYVPAPWAFMLALIMGPLLSHFLIHRLFSDAGVNLSVKEILNGAYLRTLALWFVLFCCITLFMGFVNSGFTDIFFAQLLSNIHLLDEQYEILMALIKVMLTMTSLLLFLPLLVYGTYFAYQSEKEKLTAGHLMREVEQIGLRKKAYGIWREED